MWFFSDPAWAPALNGPLVRRTDGNRDGGALCVKGSAPGNPTVGRCWGSWVPGQTDRNLEQLKERPWRTIHP
ncbi:hypothetical protein EASAB2608_00881 [Streptomyces sp. EAS-AB2608]|nr:hypothetical protein EASAB2608_00881 [Streptomyces sp. EAS-AB2608]